MSGGVEDGEVFFLGFKVSSPHLDRLPLVSLLLVRVQSPRQVPAATMFNYPFMINESAAYFLETQETEL